MSFDLFTLGLATSGALAAYHHFGFPALMAFCGRNSAVPAARANRPQVSPSLSIVMPAYNEASLIGQKIASIAASEYPADKVTVIVGCDGCTDDTVAEALRAAAEYPEIAVEVHSYDRNRGKTAVLNDLMRHVSSEITVLSDVSAILHPMALNRIATHFSNPDVGAVGGGYDLPEGASRGQRFYCAYQGAVKRGESRIAGLIGAHGALYAIRSRLFASLPAGTINDDFIIPMRIAIAGWRTVYDPSIAVSELDVVSDQCEIGRRRRIGAGNLQQLLWLMPDMLRKTNPGLMFVFLSGKALRVAMGPLILIAMICAIGLAVVEPTLGLPFVTLGVLALIHPIGRYALAGHLQSMVGALTYLAGGYRQWRRVSPAAA